jgi:hypothetical protein
MRNSFFNYFDIMHLFCEIFLKKKNPRLIENDIINNKCFTEKINRQNNSYCSGRIQVNVYRYKNTIKL